MAVPEIPDYSLLQQKLGNVESDLMSTSPASECCVVNYVVSYAGNVLAIHRKV